VAGREVTAAPTDMRVDFHLHTWCSDGALPPAELLGAVRSARVEWFAVTDHDTLAGWRTLRGTPGLLCGVEATASHGGREIHVVGLGIDGEDPAFESLLQRIRARRIERVAALLERLPADVRRGLTVDQVRDQRPGAGESVSRSHLARALVRAGGCASTRDAFAFHLGDEHLVDERLPAFMPLAEITAAIHAAGGIAMLAHPGIYRTVDEITRLMAQGCDGLETAHSGLDPTLGAALAAAATQHGWIEGVGSDTHAPSSARRPGQVQLPPERLRPLMDRLGIAVSL
jgi:3',5'-nucleoside bisphosphate phosphatase